jgi:hypothetical protein
MAIPSEPQLQPAAIRELRPTQITIGMREVAAKREHWRLEQMARGKRYQFLERHLIPVVIGPNERPYIIDHHHLARALHEEGLEQVLTMVIADLSHLPKDAFWVVLDNRGWLHPFNEHGVRCKYAEVPRSIDKLVDDPYRSLAGAVRRAGGYAKTLVPFGEFLWADFLRRRIKLSVLKKDFEYAVELALSAARDQAASYLPGWCGPVVEK